LHKASKALLVVLLIALIPLVSPPPAVRAAQPEPSYHMGALPSSPEALEAASRDQAARLRDIAATTILPSAVSLESLMPPIGDQGVQNSCVAWATAYYYKTAQEKTEHGWAVDTPLHQFSPAYVYNQSNWGGDSGITMDDALNVLLQQGVAPLSSMSYNPVDYLTQPSDSQKHEASFYRAMKKELLFNGQGSADVNALKAQLAGGGIFIVTFPIYTYTDDVLKPPTPEQIQRGPFGWHAVAVVGYDDARQAFKFANSWGQGWGNYGGYGWMKYSFVQNWAREGWTMTDRLADFDNADDARLLAAGQPITGTIDPAEDVDTYYFDATAGQTVAITMTKTTGGLDPYLELYSPKGKPLAQDDNSAGSPNALISSFPITTTGQYQIVAKNKSLTSGGTYALSLAGAAAPSNRVTVDEIRTLDNGSPTPTRRDVFFIGDQVRLSGTLDNQTGKTQTAKLEWKITDPAGKITTRTSTVTLPTGISKWPIDQTVDAGSYTGVYTSTLTATYAAMRSYLSSTYVVAQRVKILSPNGGEIYFSGQTRDVSWRGPDQRVSYTVKYSKNNGATWITAASGITGLTTPWPVPAVASDNQQVLIRVICFDDFGRQLGRDISDQPFSIDLLNIDSPSLPGKWNSGDQINIQWTEYATKAQPDSVRLFYSLNAGATWVKIDEVAPGTLSYPWTIPTVGNTKSQCMIKAVMKDASGGTISSAQTGYFSIGP
jgi:hypothetical protein